MKGYILIIVIAIAAGCNQPKTIRTESVFGKDTLIQLYEGSFITIPNGWRFANDDTLEKFLDATARFRFHNKSGKLIFIEHGLGTSGNLAEQNVLSFRFRKGYLEHSLDTSGIFFTDNPLLSNMRAKSKYKFSSEEISGFSATLYQPKIAGTGYSGLYIDSIGEIAENIVDFTIYACDLDSVENVELFKVIKTIRLKDYKF